MTIFEFSNYKDFLQKRLETLPKRGRGEILRMATHLHMHPTRMSHILKGAMNFTLEQACSLTKYLGLSELESEYFLALLNLERAGSVELRKMLESHAKKLRERAQELVNRLPRDQVLTEEQKALFYSSWVYSGVRLATSLSGCDSVEAISSYFGIPRDKVRAILDFLLTTGLVVESGGKFRMGSKTTHLERASPLVNRHHANWRLKALARHESLGEAELAYTCPVSIRKEDQSKIHEMLVQTIERFLKTVVASEPPEKLACLTIDWFSLL